jgi:hypothetical protein
MDGSSDERSHGWPSLAPDLMDRTKHFNGVVALSGASRKDDVLVCAGAGEVAAPHSISVSRRRILALGLFFQFQTYC